MRINFNDKNLLVQYAQIKLHDCYNDNIIINNKYYKTFNSNYGMAHYIAKYLNYMYPSLTNDYNNVNADIIRDINEPISIMNYFLCDNKSNKLEYVGYTDNYIYNPDIIYTQIYNIQHTNPESNIFNKKDLPLFYPDNITSSRSSKDNIYRLDTWSIDKNICEIDDIVMSYLLGMTIGPKSSMEDIYYVQQLVYGNADGIITSNNSNSNINYDKGIWDDNLTQSLINIQKTEQRVNDTNSLLLVTGYCDVKTEAILLKRRGDVKNEYIG